MKEEMSVPGTIISGPPGTSQSEGTGVLGSLAGRQQPAVRKTQTADRILYPYVWTLFKGNPYPKIWTGKQFISRFLDSPFLVFCPLDMFISNPM